MVIPNSDLPSLDFYERVSSVRWLRSYPSKITAAVFLGTHASLLVIVVVAAASSAPWPVVAAALLATLGSTVVTLGLLRRLLAPLVHISAAMQAYVEHDALPDLPTHFSDEAGQLMAQLQATLTPYWQVRRQSQLLNVFSEDLRDPASSIHVASNILTGELTRSELGSPVMREMADVIETASRQQLSLLQDLQAITTDEGIGFSIRKTVFRLHDLLRLVAATARPQAQREGICFTAQWDAAENLTLYADVGKFLYVLESLVGAAIEAGRHHYDADGAHIELRAATTPTALAFYVKDNFGGPKGDDGTSSPAQDAPFAPEAHQRQVTSNGAGASLGFRICQTFVELWHGTIERDPASGGGTAVKVQVPREYVE